MKWSKIKYDKNFFNLHFYTKFQNWWTFLFTPSQTRENVKKPGFSQKWLKVQQKWLFLDSHKISWKFDMNLFFPQERPQKPYPIPQGEGWIPPDLFWTRNSQNFQ